MATILFLNEGKINFDQKLNLSSLAKLGTITSYEKSTQEEILNRVQDQEIVISKELPLGRELITNFPDSVKLICEAGTGYNNIDMEAAKEKGIQVCNVPGYSSESVAQLAITFILNLSSSISRQQVMIKQDKFENFTNHLQVPHYEVQGKTLGIIGAGSIGIQVIKVARALGMKVLTYNRSPKQWEDPEIQSVPLDDLLKQSDFVSVHCPLTPETKYLLNKETFNKMKSTAYVINTSRGPIINEADLIEALRAGTIAGAALDVQEQEPPSIDNPLFQMDHVIMTPHIGWQAFEARQRLIDLLAANIEHFINGNPINIVK